MPHHARAAGWTSTGDRMWFRRCDQCGKRRLVDTYFEIHPPLGSKGKESGWWRACASCMVSIASDQLASATDTLRLYKQWEAALITDDAAWGTGMTERSLPVLTQALLDQLIEIQGPREEVILQKVTKGETTINHARRLLGLPKLGSASEKAARIVVGGYDVVFGPCILDEHGDPLVAVDHLAEDAEGIRDRLLEVLR